MSEGQKSKPLQPPKTYSFSSITLPKVGGEYLFFHHLNKQK